MSGALCIAAALAYLHVWADEGPAWVAVGVAGVAYGAGCMLAEGLRSRE